MPASSRAGTQAPGLPVPATPTAIGAGVATAPATTAVPATATAATTSGRYWGRKRPQWRRGSKCGHVLPARRVARTGAGLEAASRLHSASRRVQPEQVPRSADLSLRCSGLRREQASAARAGACWADWGVKNGNELTRTDKRHPPSFWRYGCQMCSASHIS